MQKFKSKEWQMNKKNIVFLILMLVSFIFALISGCAQQNSTPTPTPTPSSTITLSGTLSTGLISGSKIIAFATAADYDVIVINNNTGQTYRSVADSSGNFSVNIPSGISYEISLVDNSSSKYFGPVIMSGNTSSTEVVMGITPTTTTSLGTIVIDNNSKAAKPLTEPTTIINLQDTAKAEGGIPKGAGNYGKEEMSGLLATREGADMDKDGIPNLFDADEDNDGIRNGIIKVPSSKLVASSTIESVMQTMNIWLSHGTEFVTGEAIALRLHVIPKSGKESLISSVQCTNVPSTFKDVAKVAWAASLGDPTGYPSENSLWKDASYGLYKTTTLTPEEWIVSIHPVNVPAVGDTFAIRVSYSEGSTEDFYVTINYVLSSVPAILSYNGTAITLSQGTKTNPVEFSASSLDVVFSKPVDEDGNIIEGLTYSIRYGTTEADGSGTYGVPTNTTEISISDTGGSTLSYTIPTSSEACYYVCPVSESADGQRNGEEFWFKKI